MNNHFHAQRLTAIQEHLAREYKLLQEYEDDLALANDRRTVMRIEKEIERQRKAIGRYQQELGELTAVASPTPAAQEATEQAQASLAVIEQKLDALSQQVATEHTAIRDNLAAQRRAIASQRRAIIDRVDLRYTQTIQRVTDQLQGEQVEIVGLLVTAVDQNRIAQAQAQQIVQLTHDALRALQAAQPDAGDWQNMLRLVEQNTGWEQKLKITVPLIPYLLTYENEIKVDSLGALKQAWRQLTAPYRDQT